MALPLDHPFSQFNEFLYMESGTPKIPIYIWKKGNKGILLELYLNDHINGPRGRLFLMNFEDEYNFSIVKAMGQDISRPRLDELYKTMTDILNREFEKL